MKVVKTSYPRGFRSHWHDHPQAQLVYPSRGVMTIHTRTGTWVVPPMRGCWLPAASQHLVETTARLEMHSVYCPPNAVTSADVCGIVEVTPLMREIILALEGGGAAPGIAGSIDLLETVLARLIGVREEPQLFLPVPQSPLLLAIAEALSANPADTRTLDDWAHELATTSRTLARTFATDLSMGYRAFRRQIRLHAAMRRLAEGLPVTTVAYEAGFSSAASFGAMFKRATGRTPGTYFSPQG